MILRENWSICFLNYIFPQSDRNNGPLKGFILRHQLIVILKNKYFEEKKRFWIDDVSIENFRDEYPRYPSIKVKIIIYNSHFIIKSLLIIISLKGY